MIKLISKPVYLKKLQTGGLIPKYQKAGVLKKIYYWRSPNYEGTFDQAFAQAVKNKDEDFWWNGNIYNTKMKPESTLPTPNLDIKHKFTSRNFDEFVNVMYPIFEDSLRRKNLPNSQIQNLIRQAAYESTYGTNPRGAQGYNLGGIKWFNDPNSNTYKYKHTTNPSDGLEYVDFDSLMDYVDYKVDLLHNTYNALNARDTNDFVNRLHGNNPSKKSYSANKAGYMKTLNGMKSLDKAYNNYVAKRKQSR